ncbi:hypothetical protein [Aminobacter carboxidus]|uniref:Uncharacterized protein n=1 Tax=Aminobacter carboxidus TaxID=376165 RepID=A0A8E1WEZ6_9HYPH|nr:MULTISPECIES: hypothetical protein [Aminobacter carboxidus group]MBB6467595.1 hypothetical protein [Aminobacter lissarensis]MBE1206298.1 hypothetical protein [Aminobacter carboxidus]
MIKFSSKTDAPPKPADSDENRFDFIRKTAATQHKKSDDDIRRRDRQTADDDQTE